MYIEAETFIRTLPAILKLNTFSPDSILHK
jgi:hypothetical protein